MPIVEPGMSLTVRPVIRARRTSSLRVWALTVSFISKLCPRVMVAMLRNVLDRAARSPENASPASVGRGVDAEDEVAGGGVAEVEGAGLGVIDEEGGGGRGAGAGAKDRERGGDQA